MTTPSQTLVSGHNKVDTEKDVGRRMIKSLGLAIQTHAFCNKTPSSHIHSLNFVQLSAALSYQVSILELYQFFSVLIYPTNIKNFK